MKCTSALIAYNRWENTSPYIPCTKHLFLIRGSSQLGQNARCLSNQKARFTSLCTNAIYKCAVYLKLCLYLRYFEISNWSSLMCCLAFLIVYMCNASLQWTLLFGWVFKGGALGTRWLVFLKGKWAHGTNGGASCYYLLTQFSYTLNICVH